MKVYGGVGLAPLILPPLPDIDPRFLVRPVTILTELFRLPNFAFGRT